MDHKRFESIARERIIESHQPERLSVLPETPDEERLKFRLSIAQQRVREAKHDLDKAAIAFANERANRDALLLQHHQNELAKLQRKE